MYTVYSSSLILHSLMITCPLILRKKQLTKQQRRSRLSPKRSNRHQKERGRLKRYVCVCMRVCMGGCVHGWVHAWVRACVHACVKIQGNHNVKGIVRRYLVSQLLNGQYRIAVLPLNYKYYLLMK